MSFGLALILTLAIVGGLFYFRASLLVWTLLFAVGLAIVTKLSSATGLLTVEWVVFIIIAALLNISFLRRNLLAAPIFYLYSKIMPPMSETERQALESGDVWWEGELFSGKPHWKKLFRYPEARLTAEEQAFLDGPVQQLCEMIDDYQVATVDKNVPDNIRQFIKEHGFFGMIIPKKYGGLEFSQYMHGRVAEKLYSASITVGTEVGVPNSLGPAELLLHYGTEEQKNHYLPRLAKGDEIPCFALTGPEAGSDAGSMPDMGVVCHGEFDGKKVLGIKLNFNKRYITLAPIATVIGLAFKLYDPEHLLGQDDEIGITCALIPRDTAGIEIGKRHWPANNPFQNGPIIGRDVFIPIDWIVGGPSMAGQGWRMLMECLSVGRAISLPSTGVACSKVCAMATGAYARIRKQFNVPIGKFEAIAEKIAAIGARAYMTEAAFKMTLAALNDNVVPAVPSAILKYHLTEAGRYVVNDAMDVHAGKAVMLGPSNYLVSGYHGVPIGITVEGANILTRALIIFGQGAVRCHPYVLKEMQAVGLPSQSKGLAQFNKAFFAHIGFFISNIVRSFWLGITGARFTRVCNHRGIKRYQQHLTRFSAAFALSADMAMFTMGGNLKRKELLSARFGDVLSYLYLSSSVLRRYVEDGLQSEDLPFVQWVLDDMLHNIQNSLDAIIRNFPNRIAAALLRVLIFPLGKWFRAPSDKVKLKISEELMNPNSTIRQRLIHGMFLPSSTAHPLGLLEEAFKQCYDTEEVEKVLLRAIKDGEVMAFSYEQRVEQAQQKGIITKRDAERLIAMNKVREPIIAVDDFEPNALGK